MTTRMTAEEVEVKTDSQAKQGQGSLIADIRKVLEQCEHEGFSIKTASISAMMNNREIRVWYQAKS